MNPKAGSGERNAICFGTSSATDDNGRYTYGHLGETFIEAGYITCEWNDCSF